MGTFAGKVAIITGGASGIGKALGQEMTQRGAYVILVDMNSNLLEETVRSMTDAAFSAKAVTLDVCDFGAVTELVDDTVAEHGRLDYIFNNAGICIFGEARDFSYDDWRKIIDTNFYGVVNGVAAAYPVMVRQGFGHIINTASLAGLVPVPGAVSYTASKYGVVGLSHALRMEAEDLGVRVSVVCPGLINTPMKYSKTIKIDSETMLEKAPKLMSPKECARVILRGVERIKATIVVTRPAKLLWLLQRISPALARWLSRQLFFDRLIRDLRIED